MNDFEYMGNSSNIFDEDGYCVVDRLPWRDATDCQQALDEADEIEPFAIAEVYAKEMGNSLTYTLCESEYGYDVYVAYNQETDIHYFFI